MCVNETESQIRAGYTVYVCIRDFNVCSPLFFSFFFLRIIFDEIQKDDVDEIQQRKYQESVSLALIRFVRTIL